MNIIWQLKLTGEKCYTSELRKKAANAQLALTIFRAKKFSSIGLATAKSNGKAYVSRKKHGIFC